MGPLKIVEIFKKIFLKMRSHQVRSNRTNPNPISIRPSIDLQETLIKIEGCDSLETANKIKNCLTYYGKS